MFKDAKSIAVIGLGTFGTAFARRATENGASVTGIDIVQKKVDRLLNELHETIGADARDEKALRECALDEHDLVVIAVGRDVEASLLAAHHAKALGAKQLFVKAQSNHQEDILKAIGADRVLRPEIEAGHALADDIVSKT